MIKGLFKKAVDYTFQGVVTIISGVIVKQINGLIERNKILNEIEEELDNGTYGKDKTEKETFKN